MRYVQPSQHYFNLSSFSSHQFPFTQEQFDCVKLVICTIGQVLLSLLFTETVYFTFQVCVREPKTHQGFHFGTEFVAESACSFPLILKWRAQKKSGGVETVLSKTRSRFSLTVGDDLVNDLQQICGMHT